jgi:hypothetical protein
MRIWNSLTNIDWQLVVGHTLWFGWLLIQLCVVLGFGLGIIVIAAALAS